MIARAGVGADLVILVADLGGAGGEDEVLVAERGGNVGGREALGGELVGVDIHHDRAELPAVGQRHGGALDGGELGADEVLPHVEQLLLAHGVALQAELDDRHAGGVVLDDAGRRGPGGQGAKQGLRDGGDLRHREFDFGVRLEVDAGDRRAAIRLRLDVLDVVDRGGHGALEVGDDALFHLFGGEAVVAPDNADYGDIDIGKDIDRHRNDSGNAKNGDEERNYDERIGSA